MSSDSTEGFSVSLSGEVAVRLRKIAESKHVALSVVAREYLTDGMVHARILPEWWPRGKMECVVTLRPESSKRVVHIT
jgi:hypothetical protein